ncbi:hypothetical protein ACFU5O_10560 [Streptomyces sp. NPDC057445]|uniref:hypothetical protein n=1 Tax=Streptomyces sp. NPDC057445 TaxID=3346136 RepID=UPI0036A55A10
MILVQPVLEIRVPDGFSLWPVAECERYGFLTLSGALDPAGIGTAVASIADCNDTGAEADDRTPRLDDPLGSFLHGLRTVDAPVASGGLRVTDASTGTTLVPGCCNGLEERREWLEVVDGDGFASFGHGPSPLAERLGDMVRLTVDTERSDSPVIELPVGELRRLLTDVERDLTDFLRSAAVWAVRHLPGHAAHVITGVAGALALPAPAVPPNP